MPDSVNKRELAALIELLEDPDANVFRAVKDRLLTLGPSIIPDLEDGMRTTGHPSRRRLRRVIHGLRFATLSDEWHGLIASEEVSLEKGVFLLARYRFPKLDVSRYHALLDEWATAAKDRTMMLRGRQRAFALSDFMFRDLGFQGNSRHYYDPHNSYINWVMDHRTGIPVTLGVIYLLLGEQLDLPVKGVNMPAHFLVKYQGQDRDLFIDVFNAGTPFLMEDGIKFLERAGIDPRLEYFESADNRSILFRIVRNLLAIAEDAGQRRAIADFTSLLKPWEQD